MNEENRGRGGIGELGVSGEVGVKMCVSRH